MEHAGHEARQWERRRAKSRVDLIAQTRGTQARDKYKASVKLVKDKETTHAFSRCTNCNKEFVSDDGKQLFSQSQFCSRGCQEQYHSTHNVTASSAQHTFTQVTPEDVEWGEKQGRSAQRMPRKFKSFCPDCIEVVVVNGEEVRRTKGMYREIDHDCGEVMKTA